MGETDTRAINWFKENAPEQYSVSNKIALKVLNKVYEDAPASKLENLIYWILINYYTYEILQTICEEIDKPIETGDKK